MAKFFNGLFSTGGFRVGIKTRFKAEFVDYRHEKVLLLSGRVLSGAVVRTGAVAEAFFERRFPTCCAKGLDGAEGGDGGHRFRGTGGRVGEGSACGSLNATATAVVQCRCARRVSPTVAELFPGFAGRTRGDDGGGRGPGTGATNVSLTVNLTTTGTATSGSDYTTAPSPISAVLFGAGQTTRTITINPVDDSLTEGDEAVLLQIAAGPYDIGGLGYASVTLVDNDLPPTVFISSPGAQGVVVASSNGVEFAATAADDGVLSARLVSVTGPAAAEAGLSVRDSMHRYARRAALVYTASTKTLRFRPRVTNNTTDFSVSVANLNLPLWLRLDRNTTSNTVAAFYATNNAGVPGPWTQVSTNVVVPMDAAADYSLTADSGSDTVAALATFDTLALTPAPAGVATLVEDFGDGVQTGTYAYSAGTDTHTLMGKGSLDGSGMFWGEQFSGDCMITALQLDATSNGNDSRSGILVRDSMDDGPMAFVGRNPQGAFASFVWRTNPEGGASGLNGIARSFADLSFRYPASPFLAWQMANFVGGASNPNAAADADPDGDGLNNAGEYAYGTNPNLAGPHPVLASLTTLGTNQYLRVTVPKNPLAADATITVGASFELAPATWSTADLVIEQDTATTLQVRDSLPAASAPRRFLRVKVTLD